MAFFWAALSAKISALRCTAISWDVGAYCGTVNKNCTRPVRRSDRGAHDTRTCFDVATTITSTHFMRSEREAHGAVYLATV